MIMHRQKSNLKVEMSAIRKDLPLPLRRLGGWVKRQIFPHWIWDSKEFREYFDFLQKSQWWSLSELKAHQLEQLQALVRFA